METIKIIGLEKYVGKRVDKVLTQELQDFSRTQIQNMISKGCVEVNGKVIKASYKIELDDEVIVHIPEVESTDILPEDISLRCCL